MAIDPGDSAHARELARKSADRRAAGKLPPDLESFTILDWLDKWGEFRDPSWAAWRTCLAAIFGLPLSPDELVTYQRHTGRPEPPTQPVQEAWLVCGRKAGKSRVAAVTAVYLSLFKRHRLAPGERGVVMVLARDRRQARIVWQYTLALLTRYPEVARQLILKRRKEGVDLRNGISIEIHTANYAAVRGYTLCAAICDEVAFWSDDASANPGKEVIDALKPAMLTQPDALLLCLSSPYGPHGVLYDTYQRYYGQPDPQVLVWNSDTHSMNPTVPDAKITLEFARDPTLAASEYGQGGHVVFRPDAPQTVFDRAALAAVTVPHRLELPPQRGVRYVGFVDAAGGGGQDSMTLAIAHAQDGRAVLDLVREMRPPFNVERVCADYAATLRAYHITTVHGDRFAEAFVRAMLKRHGVRFQVSAQVTAHLYTELVPVVNSGVVELLDHPRLLAQFGALERRVGGGARDHITHPVGGHDDLATVASGALLLALPVERVPLLFGSGGHYDLGDEEAEPAAPADEPAPDAEDEPAVEDAPELSREFLALGHFPGDAHEVYEAAADAPPDPSRQGLSRFRNPPRLPTEGPVPPADPEGEP